MSSELRNAFLVVWGQGLRDLSRLGKSRWRTWQLADFESSAGLKETQRLRELVTRLDSTSRLNFDSWTGYVAERRDLLRSLRGPAKAIVYGGDSHNAWAGASRRV